jgi:hypothetical protein
MFRRCPTVSPAAILDLHLSDDLLRRWFYTDDSHIAVTGGNACLSYGPNGALTTQACGNAGVDQVWNLVTFGGSGTPPPTSTAGQQIRWSNNGVSGCLTVMDGALQNFGRIAMYVPLSLYQDQN